MDLFRWTLPATAWFLIFSSAQAQDPRPPDPLFQSNDVIDVRIVAPMSTLLLKRPYDEELDGQLQYTNDAGETVSLDIEVKTRGRFRRDVKVCRFPPLRLDFKKPQTDDTLFDKQDKVKLVTHCQATLAYEQVLLREYLAYRILNVMTDISFRVRLMRITYVDSEEKRRDETQFGFLIEHRDRLSKRIDKSYLEVERTSVRSLQADYANLISLYQYMIGNTDFSPIMASDGETCCHNHVLFGNDNEPVWSVPYDFDQSGLVNAPHAAPNALFRIRSVRQRLYRGRCRHNEHLPATIESFVEKRDDLFALIDELDGFSKRSLSSTHKFFESFYDSIGSERKVKSALIKGCI